MLGLAAVGAAVGFLVLVLWFTNRGAVEIALGDDTLEVGRTDVFAREIREGGPIIMGDLTGGRQNIILQHVGLDEERGWFAFDLIRPGQPNDCPLDWDAEDRLFRDRCDGTEVPAGGGSQPSYPVTIEDGEISIDFRAAEEPES